MTSLGCPWGTHPVLLVMAQGERKTQDVLCSGRSALDGKCMRQMAGKASSTPYCNFYFLVHLPPQTACPIMSGDGLTMSSAEPGTQGVFWLNMWMTEWMNERAHSHSSRSLWNIPLPGLFMPTGWTEQTPRTVVEWINEHPYITHMNVRLSQKPGSNRKKAAPCWGFYSSSVDPTGASHLLSLWFNYCSLRSSWQPLCLLSNCSPKCRNKKKEGKNSL